MDNNNNFNNNYYQTTQSSFEQSQMNRNVPPMQPGKKPKKSGSGFFKKLMIGLCCGLVFGLFAGAGFQAVNLAGNYVKNHVFVSRQEYSADDKAPKKPDSEEIKEAPAEEVQESATDGLRETKETLQSIPKTDAVVTDVTEVVKAVMPSVVSVSNKFVEKTSFFGQEYSSEAESSGSGIIVGKNDTELLLVTNYHVVQSANELTVCFMDEEQVEAQIKGTDADKDLAVIAVQLKDVKSSTLDQISIASLGDSDALTVGEPVIAIGNALGYGQSVTTGVVSALNRPIAATNVYGMEQQADQEVNTFIQTDAAINPGNSGGALLNTAGEVIGINSNKIGGNAVEGMGYAIPISDAKPIIEDLMTKETKLKIDDDKKGFLGITGIDVASDYAQMYGMPMGVYVSSVIDHSGADDAGLIKGDIITELNGETVDSMVGLKQELAYYEEGETVELTIMQGSPTGYQSKKVNVTLGKQQPVTTTN